MGDIECPDCFDWPGQIRTRLAAAERVVEAAKDYLFGDTATTHHELGAALAAHEEVTRGR